MTLGVTQPIGTLVSDLLARPGDRMTARAIFPGERIDTRAREGLEGPRLADHPLLTAVPGGGWAVVFRYGAVVFFDTPNDAQRVFLESLGIQGRFDEPEREGIEIRIDETGRDGVADGALLIQEASRERIQLIAEVLAKSVVLAHYEEVVAETFDSIEPLAVELKRGKVVRRSRSLLKQIGSTLLIQHRMVGRVEINEKPELLWERPDLERLYMRLDDEFELHERHTALERKLVLISDINETLLEMLQTRQGLRLELYIVLLIVFDIVLSLLLR